jgi:hypothetical protein
MPASDSRYPDAHCGKFFNQKVGFSYRKVRATILGGPLSLTLNQVFACRGKTLL